MDSDDGCDCCVLFLGGGAVAVCRLIRSIGPLLAEAISNGWSRDRVISLLKRSALLVYALLFLSLLPWSVLLTTAGRPIQEGQYRTPTSFGGTGYFSDLS